MLNNIVKNYGQFVQPNIFLACCTAHSAIWQFTTISYVAFNCIKFTNKI